MNPRTAVFLALTAASLAACALMGTGCATVHNCGDWRVRPSDGATCRECRDHEGGFSQCHMETR